MLGFILRGLLVATAIATVTAIVVYVSGQITRSKLEEKMHDYGITNAVIEKIDYCDNIVSLKDIVSDKKIEVHGDDVDYNLDEGNLIYV